MMDSDKSGYFNSYELRTALSSLGMIFSLITSLQLLYILDPISCCKCHSMIPLNNSMEINCLNFVIECRHLVIVMLCYLYYLFTRTKVAT